MNAKKIRTIEDAERFTEGVINDFETGICDKAETMKQLGNYTGAIMELFLRNYLKLQNTVSDEVISTLKRSEELVDLLYKDDVQLEINPKYKETFINHILNLGAAYSKFLSQLSAPKQSDWQAYKDENTPKPTDSKDNDDDIRI